MEDLRELLESGVDPDLTFNGTPPIWRAAWTGNLDNVIALIDAGANVDATNRNGTTALYVASQLSVWGSTALTVATEMGETGVMERLLENNAQTDIVTSATNQSILWMAALNGDAEMVEALLREGAELDQADSSGATPLYAAAANGHTSTVELLLSEGAAVDAARLDGNTALHAASARCSPQIVQILLAAGADRELRNADNRRPVDLACVLTDEDDEGRLEIEGNLVPLIGAARVGDEERVTVLVESEDVDAQVRSGKTALIYAARNGHEDVIDILVEAGADVDLTDHAAALQTLDCIRALAGSNVQLLNNMSWTPLMVAVGRADPNLDTVQALLEIGSDPNTRSEVTGDTALHIAARFADREIVAALLKAGAENSIRNAEGDRPRAVIGEEAELSREERVQLQRLISGREKTYDESEMMDVTSRERANSPSA